MRFVRWILLAGLLLNTYPAQAEDPQTSLSVFAAASLRDVMTEVAAVFQQKYGTRVELNFAGTNELRLQIEKGAPCDVCVSADVKNIERLSEQNLVSFNGQAVIAHNALVVVGHKEDMAVISDLKDLEPQLNGYLSLADPETVPAGKYAKEALTTAGLWEKIREHIAPAVDVRAALAQVERGNARFGIVYRTDAVISDEVRIVYEVPQSSHSPVTYVAALIRGPHDHPWAKKFFEFLTSPEAQTIFKQYGFQPVHE